MRIGPTLYTISTTNIVAVKSETVLAEECAELLRTSRKTTLGNVAICAQIVELPGRSQFVTSEPGIFAVANMPPKRASEWNKLVMKWLESIPGPPNSSPRATNQASLELELTLARVLLVKKDRLEISIAMRAIDRAGEKTIGRQCTVRSCKIRPVTLTSEPNSILEDFRRAMNEVARQGLTELRLL